jgi:copper(I)-binding protein
LIPLGIFSTITNNQPKDPRMTSVTSFKQNAISHRREAQTMIRHDGNMKLAMLQALILERGAEIPCQ